MDTEEQAKEYTLHYLNLRFGAAYNTIQRNQWVRIDRIAKRLLGIEDLSFLEWLYAKIAFTGLGNEEARYVMIDEVQDYSPAQLAVLTRFYRRAHFLLLGDENQAITAHSSSFDEVRTVFRQHRGSMSECQLLTSYRSTPAITKLFASLAHNSDALQISSVQRDDTEPEIQTYTSSEDFHAAFTKAVTAAHAKGGLTAIIVHSPEELSEYWNALSECIAPDQLTFVSEDTTLPDEGVVLISLLLAKGLEFDHVIIPDATQDIYPQTDLARRQLYTAISRATNSVVILAKGPLSSLLPHA